MCFLAAEGVFRSIYQQAYCLAWIPTPQAWALLDPPCCSYIKCTLTSYNDNNHLSEPSSLQIIDTPGVQGIHPHSVGDVVGTLT